jgi:hypothetical protein
VIRTLLPIAPYMMKVINLDRKDIEYCLESGMGGEEGTPTDDEEESWSGGWEEDEEEEGERGLIQGERRGGRITVGAGGEGGVVPLQPPPAYPSEPIDLLSSPSPWVVTSEWTQGGQGGAFVGGEVGGTAGAVPPLYGGGSGPIGGAPSFLPPIYPGQGEAAPPPAYGWPQGGFQGGVGGHGGMGGGMGGVLGGGGQGGWYGPGAVGLAQGGQGQGQEGGQGGQGIGDRWVRREQLPPLTPTTTL